MKKTLNKINKITVFGAGVSGKETVRWAVSAGKQVCLSDNKPLSALGDDFIDFCNVNSVHIEAGGHTLDSVKNAGLVVVSPGISPDLPIINEIKRAKIPIMGEIDLAMRLWDGPIIGITGTNGKTTTTSLTGAIFQDANVPVVIAGNIGKPLISYVTEGKTDRVAVLEISSFQIDYFSKVNDLGEPLLNTVAITNITPDHLDRYGNMDNYTSSKLRIANFLAKGGFWVINSGLSCFRNRFDIKPDNIITFGDNASGYFAKIDDKCLSVELPGQKEEFDISNWGLKGAHNLENLCCAIIIALVQKVERDAVQKTIENFQAPAHRIQFVEKINNVDYYNDSKATNVASVIKALEAISEPVILLAGGRGKGEDYLPLRHFAFSKKIKAVILVGEEADKIKKVFEDILTVKMIDNKEDGFSTFHEALLSAYKTAAPGDVVLLSPACASFDMFKNYEERGMAFIKAVNEIKEKYGNR